jgi:hypothetical protein
MASPDAATSAATRNDNARLGGAVTNIMFVRWRRGESRRGPTLGPLDPAHPAAPARCVLCVRPLGCHRSTQLLIVGPRVDDVADNNAHHAHAWYPALAVIVHTDCMRAHHTDEALEDIVLRLVPVDQGQAVAGSRHA